MCHEIGGSENYFIGDQVLMFQVVESSLIFDCKNVAVSIQETIVEGVNGLVGSDEFSKLVLSDYTHESLGCDRENLIVSVPREIMVILLRSE